MLSNTSKFFYKVFFLPYKFEVTNQVNHRCMFYGNFIEHFIINDTFGNWYSSVYNCQIS